jgi:hypothetical protein
MPDAPFAPEAELVKKCLLAQLLVDEANQNLADYLAKKPCSPINQRERLL